MQAYDLSKSLENRFESVRDNLEILANAPLIQLGEHSQARILVNTAENSTEGFTDTYFWIDENGKLQWSGAFVDQKVYDQYYGGDRTDRPYLLSPEILTSLTLAHCGIQLMGPPGFTPLIQ